MAKSKRNTPQRDDPFRVGQTVKIVMTGQHSTWQRAHGELGTVVAPKAKGQYGCGELDRASGTRGAEWIEEERYAVRWSGGVHHFAEYMLRAIYDGEKLSTWREFARITGIGVEPAKAIAPQRRTRGAEARHG